MEDIEKIRLLAKTLVWTYSDISDLLNANTRLSLDRRGSLKKTQERISAALHKIDAVKGAA